MSATIDHAGRLVIDGRRHRIHISHHAVDRFIERVRPGLEDREAREEICRLLPAADLEITRPHGRTSAARVPVASITIADCTFIARRTERGVVLTTTLDPLVRHAALRQAGRHARRNLKRDERQRARRAKRRGRVRAPQTRRQSGS